MHGFTISRPTRLEWIVLICTAGAACVLDVDAFGITQKAYRSGSKLELLCTPHPKTMVRWYVCAGCGSAGSYLINNTGTFHIPGTPFYVMRNVTNALVIKADNLTVSTMFMCWHDGLIQKIYDLFPATSRGHFMSRVDDLVQHCPIKDGFKLVASCVATCNDLVSCTYTWTRDGQWFSNVSEIVIYQPGIYTCHSVEDNSARIKIQAFMADKDHGPVDAAFCKNVFVSTNEDPPKPIVGDSSEGAVDRSGYIGIVSIVILLVVLTVWIAIQKCRRNTPAAITECGGNPAGITVSTPPPQCDQGNAEDRGMLPDGGEHQMEMADMR